MKQNILNLLLLLLISITAYNCQNDDDLENNINLQTRNKVLAKRVTLNDIKENSQLRQSLTEIENQFDYFKRNELNAKINSTDNSFVILTDEILQVITDSTEAYTFRIEIPIHPDSAFENFVIEKRNENENEYEYEFFIYRYNKLEMENMDETVYSIIREPVSSDQINLNNFDDYINKMAYYDPANNCWYTETWDPSCDCQYVEYVICHYGEDGGSSSGGGGGGGSDSPETSNPESPGSIPGSFGDGESSGGNSGGSSGGSSGPNPGNGGGSTIGVLPNLNSQLIKQFFISLDTELKTCLNSNLNFKTEVSEFLTINIGPINMSGNGQNAQTVATEIINSFCNNSDVDNFEEALQIAIVNNQEIEDFFAAQIIIAPDNPIADISEYLECFDTTQGAEITIFVNQPIAGQDDAFTTGNDKAGHAFISISQGDIIRVYGLYPEGNASPFYPSDPHTFGNNQGDAFDVSISFNINGPSLLNIIEDAETYNLNYDLNGNNCTDYVLDVAGLAGITLPDPQGTWPNGQGSNPGAFGESLRELTLLPGMTRDLDGGNADLNIGDCP